MPRDLNGRTFVVGIATAWLAACAPMTGPSQSYVAGFILDTAFHPIAGAKVQLLDGPDARNSVLTTAAGTFTLVSIQRGPVTFQATHDGFQPASGASTWQLSTSTAYNLFLEPTGGSMTIAPGPYTIVVTADASCTNIPADLQTRTYHAVLTPRADHPTTQFGATVIDANVMSPGFSVGVAGNTVGVSTASAWFQETVPSRTTITIGGMAAGVTPTIDGTTISFPFSGTFNILGSGCPSHNHLLKLIKE